MKLRELIVLDSSRPVRGESACESCGEEFACGASLAGCWCSEVKLDDAARAELRARFRRCLCRACLEGYAARGAEEGARDGL
jgi:Cysteine-rich CWC